MIVTTVTATSASLPRTSASGVAPQYEQPALS
jgi:hypothetical protein